ncbi:hypothetical protein BGZ68_003383, partial [Mortierella alpina]
LGPRHQVHEPLLERTSSPHGCQARHVNCIPPTDGRPNRTRQPDPGDYAESI